jgi:hypothetical protein
MSKLVLTEEQKKRWVEEDYANGRTSAMFSISSCPQGINAEGIISMFILPNDRRLRQMYLKLLTYNDFGSGDEFETKWWHKIWDYLELNEAYEKYWEDSL